MDVKTQTVSSESMEFRFYGGQQLQVRGFGACARQRFWGTVVGGGESDRVLVKGMLRVRRWNAELEFDLLESWKPFPGRDWHICGVHRRSLHSGYYLTTRERGR